MKKIFSLLLVFAMALSFCACGVKKESDENKAPTKTNEEKTEVSEESVDSHSTESGVEITVLGCAFDYEVMGLDEEISSWGYTKRDGKVYVNLSLKIINNSEETLNEDNISGYFEYDELRYDLQYDLASVAPEKNSDGDILPGNVGMVNMLSLVDEAAMQTDIVVKYSISGNDYEEKVKPLDESDALSKKEEVSKGDKFDVNGLYSVEVVECSSKNYLQTTNFEESEQYTFGEDKKVVDLVLKVKNNTDIDLDDIKGYIIINNEIYNARAEIEIDNNTDLGTLGTIESLKSGEEEYIHIYTAIDKNIAVNGLAMRFNLAGNCYYCYVQ